MFKVGDRIEGRWKNGTTYYPGVVSATNENGSYQINFDDGCFEPNEPEAHLRAVVVVASSSTEATFAIGDRIEGRWKGGATWYPGLVSRINPNGTYQIKFDDGCVEESQQPGHLRKIDTPSSSPIPSSSITSSPTSSISGPDGTFSVGQRIEGRWKLSAKYYLGVVTAINPDGSCAIQFDDGCFEPTEHVSHMRPVAVLESPPAGSLSVGTAVKAKYLNSPKYFLGKVAAIHPDGAFRIDFLDGTNDDHVPLENITSVDPNAALHVISNGTLYRIDVESGEFDKLNSSWSKTTAMCRLGDYLFVIDGGTLYRVSPADGSYVKLSGSWPHTVAMTSANDKLFIIDNDSLYRVDPQNGAYERLSGGWTKITGSA
jgi:hypothetical protein